MARRESPVIHTTEVKKIHEEFPDRTPRDFVKDMASRGKTNQQIFAVAKCTRWEKQMDEVQHWVVKRADRWRSEKCTE